MELLCCELHEGTLALRLQVEPRNGVERLSLVSGQRTPRLFGARVRGHQQRVNVVGGSVGAGEVHVEQSPDVVPVRHLEHVLELVDDDQTRPLRAVDRTPRAQQLLPVALDRAAEEVVVRLRFGLPVQQRDGDGAPPHLGSVRVHLTAQAGLSAQWRRVQQNGVEVLQPLHQ